MRFLPFLAFLASTAAFASPETYKLKLELSIGTDEVTKTTLVVREGQQAMISQRRDDSANTERTISAVASRVPGSRTAVRVEFEITDSHGRSRTVLAKPTVVARFGQQATLEQSSWEPGKSLKLSVVASKKR